MNYSNFPAEAVSEMEQIDRRLDEIDEETRDLLDQRSRLVEDHI